MNTIYYIPLDEMLNEIEPVVGIQLDTNGVADISELPKKIADRLTYFGVLDPTHTKVFFPKEGEAFLEALCNSSSLYERFREDPTIRKNI